MPDDAGAGARLTGGPVVVGATTMLRDSAYQHSRALGQVRERLRGTRPALLEHDVHLTVTAQPDGSLVLGDGRVPAAGPGRSEAVDELLLQEAAELLGVDRLTVVSRWSAPEVALADATSRDPFVVTEPLPGVRTVTVTDGLATTTALGLAPKVLDALF
ncbi:hypothetical protein ACNHYB_10010 [Isoptericola jiangsuensis]|uniref:hypothetical protein n=1 Tax=Isoptericola jiangsuensis TaxID=548579 RepID=UPI003AAF3FB6